MVSGTCPTYYASAQFVNSENRIEEGWAADSLTVVVIGRRLEALALRLCETKNLIRQF